MRSLQMFLGAVYQSLHRPTCTRSLCLAIISELSTRNISFQQHQKCFYYPHTTSTTTTTIISTCVNQHHHPLPAVTARMLSSQRKVFFLVLQLWLFSSYSKTWSQKETRPHPCVEDPLHRRRTSLLFKAILLMQSKRFEESTFLISICKCLQHQMKEKVN